MQQYSISKTKYLYTTVIGVPGPVPTPIVSIVTTPVVPIVPRPVVPVAPMPIPIGGCGKNGWLQSLILYYLLIYFIPMILYKF